MSEGIDLDRRAIRNGGAKRSTLDQLGLNTAGVYGNLEALMGSSSPTVELLQLPTPSPPRLNAA